MRPHSWNYGENYTLPHGLDSCVNHAALLVSPTTLSSFLYPSALKMLQHYLHFLILQMRLLSPLLKLFLLKSSKSLQRVWVSIKTSVPSAVFLAPKLIWSPLGALCSLTSCPLSLSFLSYHVLSISHFTLSSFSSYFTEAQTEPLQFPSLCLMFPPYLI